MKIYKNFMKIEKKWEDNVLTIQWNAYRIKTDEKKTSPQEAIDMYFVKKSSQLKRLIMKTVCVLYVFIFLFSSCALSENSQFNNDYEKLDRYIKRASEYVLPLYRGEPLTYELDVVLETENSTELPFWIPEDGCYEIWLSYCNMKDSYLPTSLDVQIDGKSFFSEMRNIELRSVWVSQDQTVLDRYSNEIPAMPHTEQTILEAGLADAEGRCESPFLFELPSGRHTLRLRVNDGVVRFYQCSFRAKQELPLDRGMPALGDRIILMEGEDILSRNSAGIHAAGDFNVSLSPHDKSIRMLNHLSAQGFDGAGDMVSYGFCVEKEGWYQFTAFYKQSVKADFPVFMDVLIDGEIPSQAARAVPFPYTNRYTWLAASGDGLRQTFYLTEGGHMLSLRITDAPLAEAYETLDTMLSEINALSLEIIRLSGGITTDRYRDYNLLSYIPDTKILLENWADQCDSIYASMALLSGKEECGMFSDLLLCADQLRRLAEEPEDLPRRLSELSTGSNSVMNYLAQQIQKMMHNGVSIDRLAFLQEDAALPEAEDFMEKAEYGMKRLLSSFTVQDYSAGTDRQDSGRLKVWMARGRQYVELLQTIIDTEFTPATGIQVDLSIMPGENKLVLANAAGKTPDVALSLAPGTPSNLDIRGALYDMTQFPDFCEVARNYSSSLFVPYIYEGGVYALPETVYFCVLYYREDILSALNIPVPQTMEELRLILPELQRRGMNFFYPTAGMAGLKYFSSTLPLILQNGGAVYGETVGTTRLTSEESLAGFRELTNLFTKYNVPVDVSAGFFQQFRQGILPIGISDIWTYNQLVNAAPELNGLWKIALIPGVKNEDGEILRWSAGNLTAMSILADTDMPEEAWTFVKWFASKETQSEYCNRLVYTYGGDYIWATANREAFREMPIKEEHKKVILEQMEWMTDIPGVVGSYMAERELSNAFLEVVTQGKDPRRALDEAAKKIDRETFRKLEEFGYYKDGEMIRTLVTPPMDYVANLIAAYEDCREEGE